MTDDADGSTATENADGSTAAENAAGGRSCPMCDATLYRRHCKYVCPNHGVVMDCADTFHLQRE
jgi:hypothetical protein